LSWHEFFASGVIGCGVGGGIAADFDTPFDAAAAEDGALGGDAVFDGGVSAAEASVAAGAVFASGDAVFVDWVDRVRVGSADFGGRGGE